jgi:hypothetical protein
VLRGEVQIIALRSESRPKPGLRGAAVDNLGPVEGRTQPHVIGVASYKRFVEHPRLYDRILAGLDGGNRNLAALDH